MRAAGESTPPSRLRTGFRRLGASALLVVCAGGLWFLFPNSAPPPEITIMPPEYSFAPPPLRWPDRWIPRNWGWLWRLRYAVLGRPATVDIETRLIFFREQSSRPLPPSLDEDAALVSSNGVRAWIVPESEIKPLKSKLGRQAADQRIARMRLGFGVLATMSMGGSPPFQGIQGNVGQAFTFGVRKRGKSVELTATCMSTELVTNASFRAPEAREIISLHTNLALAARMLIPRGQSVFLYDTNLVHAANRSVGLLIQPIVKQ